MSITIMRPGRNKTTELLNLIENGETTLCKILGPDFGMTFPCFPRQRPNIKSFVNWSSKICSPTTKAKKKKIYLENCS